MLEKANLLNALISLIIIFMKSKELNLGQLANFVVFGLAKISDPSFFSHNFKPNINQNILLRKNKLFN